MPCPSTPLLLLTALFTFAANASPADAGSTCPVELLAEQAHDGAFADLASSSASNMHALQVLELSIANTGPRAIVAAVVEVHGTTATRRMLPLESAGFSDKLADAVRTMRLDATVAANQTATQRLRAESLSSVQWLSVTELQYADGSRWHATHGQVCRVVPNPLLRIASDRNPQ